MHNVQWGLSSVCTMFSRACLQYAQCSVGFVFSTHNVQLGFVFNMHNVQWGLSSVCILFSRVCLQFAYCSVGFVFSMHNVQ